MSLKTETCLAALLALLMMPAPLVRGGEVSPDSADLSGNGTVGTEDIDILINAWGDVSTPIDIVQDSPINGPTSAGVVDIDDLNFVQYFLGTTIPRGDTENSFTLYGVDFGGDPAGQDLLKGTPITTDSTFGFYIDPDAGTSQYSPTSGGIIEFPAIEFTSYVSIGNGPSTDTFDSNHPTFSSPGFGAETGHFDTLGSLDGACFFNFGVGSTSVPLGGEGVHVARLTVSRDAVIDRKNAHIRVLLDLGQGVANTVLLELDGRPVLFDEFGNELDFPIEARLIATVQVNGLPGVGDVDVYDVYIATSAALIVEQDGAGDVFSSIQAAIKSAVSGNTIIVRPGTYFESIDFGGKSLTIQSMDPTDPQMVANTIIDGDTKRTAVRFRNFEDADAILDGFTIRNGNANSGNGGGIEIDQSSPTIRNCTLINNVALVGGAIDIIDGDPRIENCNAPFAVSRIRCCKRAAS